MFCGLQVINQLDLYNLDSAETRVDDFVPWSWNARRFTRSFPSSPPVSVQRMLLDAAALGFLNSSASHQRGGRNQGSLVKHVDWFVSLCCMIC